MLGCGATMTELIRTQSGSFKIDDSYTIEELEKMSLEERASLLISTESLFDEAQVVNLPPFYARLCRSGCEIYQKKLHTSLPLGTFVRIYDENGFFALGEVKDYPDGSAIKAVKLFVL